MRYVAGIYVADDPRVWTWAVDAIQEHVLAAEERPLGRWFKHKVFLWLRRPGVRRILPLRSPADVRLLAAAGEVDFDLAFRRSLGKWVSFRLDEGLITRYFPSRWRWRKERWIRSLAAVAATSPPMLGWDEARLISQEAYIPGRPVRVYDLDEGLAAWRELWPLLVEVFRTRTSVRSLGLPYWVRQPHGRAWLQRLGLVELVDEVGSTPVLHGLVHGDLQQSNMIAARDRFYVIDWGDHFHLGPPLYDLLFYLFKHARSVGTDKVVDAALSDPSWIEERLPGALSPESVKASLVGFTLMLVRRYQFRNVRRRHTLVRHLRPFVVKVAKRLLVPPEPFARLPAVLLMEGRREVAAARQRR